MTLIQKMRNSIFMLLAILIVPIRLNIELMTGSGISILSDEMYNKYFLSVPLIPTNTRKEYVLGKILVNVKLENKCYKQSQLLALQGSGVNILGRDWLSYIKVD